MTSNHYRVVLHLDSEMAEAWTDDEVAERWHHLFHGSLLSKRFVRGENLTSAEL